MKTFEYKGLNREGRPCRGLIEALTTKEARERLAGRGILAERLHPTGRKIRFPSQQRSMVYRELSALLGAGIPLVRALDTLIESPELAAEVSLLAGVKDRLRDGVSLAVALGDASPSVTPFERSIIEAAERSASVEIMLERLADFIEEQDAMREKVQAALFYPLIVLTAGVCVAILMLGLLLPRARGMLADGGAALPGITAFMMSLGSFLSHWGVPILVAAMFGAAYLRVRLAKDLRFRCDWDRFLFRLPIWSRGYTILVNLRFARTFAILLRGGVPLIDGLLLSGRASGSPWVEQLSVTEAESVRHGGSLADALRRVPPLAGSLPGWVQTGEAGGSLEKMLDNAGRRYQTLWERFVSRTLRALEPILILVIGGFVLLVTLSILLPIISMTQTVLH
jgi:general secretion pathway protein F